MFLLSIELKTPYSTVLLRLKETLTYKLDINVIVKQDKNIILEK